MADRSTVASMATAVGTLVLAEGHWLCSMVRHCNLDRPDPR